MSSTSASFQGELFCKAHLSKAWSKTSNDSPAQFASFFTQKSDLSEEEFIKP